MPYSQLGEMGFFSPLPHLPSQMKGMKMNIVDPRTIRPYELKSGDVMMLTVVCYIERRNGSLIAKLYKSPFPYEGDSEIPQGPQVAEITCEKSEGYDLMRLLFPVVMYEMEHLKASQSMRKDD